MLSSLASAVGGVKNTATAAAGAVHGGVSKAVDSLSVEEIVAALKEALNAAAERAVACVSAVDGFMGNPSIRVPMPDDIARATSILGKIPGISGKVDEFLLAMNRAAEMAAAAAVPIFLIAIRDLTLQKAKELLVSKTPTAATQHFDASCRPSLYALFLPIVVQKMQDCGVVRVFDEIADAMGKVPIVGRRPTLDVGNHVTTKALDGLFLVIGQQETKIRTDKTSRVTPLMDKVFSCAEQ